ncbi:MAG: type VI secretion system baseplate subunit TssG, partial [Pseudomonadota bacterium]
LMRLEALNADKPRLGDSSGRREEYVDLGQVPHLDFPASNVARFDPSTPVGKPLLRVKFLGMLGPMGPLPSATTDEALGWYAKRDEAFVRFLDIFNNRFLQLFYRAFADANTAPQALRPDDDRFREYVGSVIGIGTPDWHNLDEMPDYQKLAFAGLLAKRNIGAAQIEYLMMGVCGVRAEVEEFIGSTLPVDPDEQTALGMARATLGATAMIGSKVFSVETKFRLRLFPETLETYTKFLPDGPSCRRMVDAMINAIGYEYEWDVELVLPYAEVQSTRLGSYGQLGWTSWMRKVKVGETTTVRTRFQPLSDDPVAATH